MVLQQGGQSRTRSGQSGPERARRAARNGGGLICFQRVPRHQQQRLALAYGQLVERGEELVTVDDHIVGRWLPIGVRFCSPANQT